MKNRIFSNSLWMLLAAGAMLVSPACNDDIEQAELYPITIISGITLADADGYTLAMSDELPVVIGAPVQLQYTVTPEQVTCPGVTFTVANPAVAGVSADGLITGLTDGKTTLTVTPTYAYTTSIAITLNVVTTPVPVTDIVISDLPEKIFEGETATVSAVLVPTDATFQRVKFEALTPEYATITPEGLITGIAKGAARFKVSATDKSNTSKEFSLEIDHVVPVESATITNKPDITADPTEYMEFAVGESYQLTYTMTPADGSAFTLTWSSSNPEVAKVSDAGQVTFLKAGTATVTLTCPDTNYTDDVAFTVGEGYVREEFEQAGDFAWDIVPSHKNQGAVSTWMPSGFLHCQTYLSGTTGRADFSKTADKITLHAGNYPIFAIKMTNPVNTHKAEGVTQCRITLDVAPNLGSFGNGFNKYTTLDSADGISIYYYDLSTGTFGGSKVKMATDKATELTVYQLKIADIKTISASVYYNVYWVRSFKSVADLKAFVAAHQDTPLE